MYCKAAQDATYCRAPVFREYQRAESHYQASKQIKTSSPRSKMRSVRASRPTRARRQRLGQQHYPHQLRLSPRIPAPNNSERPPPAPVRRGDGGHTPRGTPGPSAGPAGPRAPFPPDRPGGWAGEPERAADIGGDAPEHGL